MNTKRIIDALKVIRDECATLSCVDCPIQDICLGDEESSLWGYADRVVSDYERGQK